MTEGTGGEVSYRRAPDVAEVLDAGRVVLLHLPSGRRTVLSDTAGAVWQAVAAAGDAGAQVADMAPALAERYGADPVVVAADISRLLVQLREAQLVTILAASERARDVNGRLGAVVVAALLLVTGVVVALALRSPSPPPSPVQFKPNVGALAVAGGGVAWRWVGPSDCPGTGDEIPVQRATEGGWVDSPIPLVTVTHLSFRRLDDGIAVGTTTTCGRGVALTRDGGATWQAPAGNPPLEDAWWVGNRVWGITAAGGPARLVRYEVRGYRLVRERETSPACDVGDGSPTLTAFMTPSRGVLLCQRLTEDGRLIARTLDSGENWERWVDGRVVSGLDGRGPIIDLDAVPGGGGVLWTVFAKDECPEGGIRRSTGRTFDRLPCPAATPCRWTRCSGWRSGARRRATCWGWTVPAR